MYGDTRLILISYTSIHTSPIPSIHNLPSVRRSELKQRDFCLTSAIYITCPVDQRLERKKLLVAFPNQREGQRFKENGKGEKDEERKRIEGVLGVRWVATNSN